ncbi:dihydrolipoamide acetyltransferase family protein [Bacteroidota bacterium]
MAKYDIIMPKLGESVEEATILRWYVKEGDLIEEDQPVVELATDKVDSEIPSPVAGKVVKILFPEGELVPVGKVIAVIDMEGESAVVEKEVAKAEAATESTTEKIEETPLKTNDLKSSDRFYSPLVKTIAAQEGIQMAELENIQGSGANGRVTKNDILAYLNNRKTEPKLLPQSKQMVKSNVAITVNPGDEVVPMGRMRKLIADHMVMSVHTSAHVTSVVEADVTNLANWRNRVKDEFLKKYGQKLTFMPIFTEAVAKALRDFPQVNASTDGENIIFRKQVNVGIAVALPDWNLIVPVIKNADQKNLAGLATDINTLAKNARENKLNPDDVSGGTFSITNFGTFDNLFGTPVINQPQVAILATGNIVKKPAVLETDMGDVIAIRHKMYLSLSYDHRIVDGALGGAFVKRVAEYLQDFDVNRKI